MMDDFQYRHISSLYMHQVNTNAFQQ